MFHFHLNQKIIQIQTINCEHFSANEANRDSESLSFRLSACQRFPQCADKAEPDWIIRRPSVACQSSDRLVYGPSGILPVAKQIRLVDDQARLDALLLCIIGLIFAQLSSASIVERLLVIILAPTVAQVAVSLTDQLDSGVDNEPAATPLKRFETRWFAEPHQPPFLHSLFSLALRSDPQMSTLWGEPIQSRIALSTRNWALDSEDLSAGKECEAKSDQQD